MITCKNDRLLELLWFVGYCIEFPTQLAVRIGGGAEWNRRVMYRAIREGYVRLYWPALYGALMKAGYKGVFMYELKRGEGSFGEMVAIYEKLASDAAKLE